MSVGTDGGGRGGTRSVRLRFPARPAHAALARLVLGGLAPLADLDAATLADLKRALTEAVSSALGAREGAGGAVEIRYELTAAELRIEVTGDGADPAGATLGAVATRTIVLERDTASRPRAGAERGRFAVHPGPDA